MSGPVYLVAELTAERDQLRAALALGQKNCDAEYDDLRAERDAARARAERAEAESVQLRAEVRMLRAALETITDAWRASHETNPFRAGDVMLAIAEKALGEREA